MGMRCGAGRELNIERICASMPGPSNKKKKQKGKAKEKSKPEEIGGEKRVVASPIARTVEEAMFEPPFIHDPGNGPRVRDVKMFIESSFAQPVAQDDEMCREFGQKEMLEMLSTILPEDTALVGGCISNSVIEINGLYEDYMVQQKQGEEQDMSYLPATV